jgi:hypothetical protein
MAISASFVVFVCMLMISLVFVGPSEGRYKHRIRPLLGKATLRSGVIQSAFNLKARAVLRV